MVFAAVMLALAPIAGWLSASPSLDACMKGTTADAGLMSGHMTLSELRANRVRAELMPSGIGRRQIADHGHAGQRM